MRYLYAKFKNYIGLYNGLGLNTVEIDFTKCRNNIVLITGINGCGKSTLLDALSPFVDPSSSYIPSVDASKTLRLVHEGDFYEIFILSPASGDGRKTTKAFIKKNGIELNENGNVTSYKDILFSEFDMDSNYLSLTRLSSIDRGLGDKTPAERKKFAASIIDNLEVYNDIYKVLNKKSTIFKSHINTLHTKIQNIGSKEEIQIRLNMLRRESDAKSEEIMNLNNQIVGLETRGKINQEDATKMEELRIKLQEIKSRLDAISSSIQVTENKLKIRSEDVESELKKNQDLIIEYIKKQEKHHSDWKRAMEQSNVLSETIHQLEVENVTYNSSIDWEFEERFRSVETVINNLKKRIRENSIPTDTFNIIELNNLIEFYKVFIQKIDLFYDGLEEYQLKYIALDYDSERTKKLQDEYDRVKYRLDELHSLISQYSEFLGIVMTLNKRPKGCKIDKCEFISQAMDVLDSVGSEDSISDQLKEYRLERDRLMEKSFDLGESLRLSELCDRKRMELDMIMSDIMKNSPAINKFDPGFGDLKLFQKNIAVHFMFNAQRDPQRLISSLNDLTSLSHEMRTYDIMKEKFSVIQDKMKIIDENEKKLGSNRELLTKNNANIRKYKSEYEKMTELVNRLENTIKNLKILANYLQEYKAIEAQELVPVMASIEEIEKKSSQSSISISQISEMKMKIFELNKELNPINSEIQKISGQMILLDSYYQEHEMYNTKYTMIETLKKYCSPTGGGIQTIFMQLYMSKTLEIANQILGMLFMGEYRLQDFIINQNEFRIPFIGSGLPVDDISSGSCSQICMMGLAINMALFYQASTKYNIARFDEIDQSLDIYNRANFINIVLHMIQILNIEQVFIISHAIEIDNSLADIIKLKTNKDSSGEQVLMGNIIYNYDDELRKEIEK